MLIATLSVVSLLSQLDGVLAGPVKRQTDLYSIQTSPPEPPESTSSEPFFGFPTSSSSSAIPFASSQQPLFPSSSSDANPLSTASIASFPAPTASLAPGQSTYDSTRFLIYNAEEVHYPFTIHAPDRSTRGLPPLEEPWPMILNLGGSGARGDASLAETLSGYDATGRFIKQYNNGNRSSAHLLAAEEVLTVTPICPNETAQPDAQWDVNVMGNIIAQVAATYQIDASRIYVTTYSMGARAAWNLIYAYPNLFAGTVISSGANFRQAYEMGPLLGNSIRNYYGSIDEKGLANATLNTQKEYDDALYQALLKNDTSVLRTRTLETIGPILGADHLDMTFRPYEEDVLTDGSAGALAWLLTQSRPEAVIPAYNASVCTTCIPPSSNITKY